MSLNQQSPWTTVIGWSLNATPSRVFRFDIESVKHVENDVETDSQTDEKNITVTLTFESNTIIASCGDSSIQCEAYLKDDELTVITGHAQRLYVSQFDKKITLFIDGKAYHLSTYSAEFSAEGDDDSGQLTAPMNGRIVDVFVSAGESVELDQPLAILEAMKMEHTIRAPTAGIISEVFYAPGDLIDDGAPLLAFEAPNEKGE